jgi:hypothetical protein
MSFKLLVEEVVDRQFDGVAGRLATALGITHSALIRAVKTETLAVENILKFAAVSGEPVSRVLKLAGKSEIAELLEQLYGDERPMPAPLSDDDRTLVRLPPSVKLHIFGLISSVLEQR